VFHVFLEAGRDCAVRTLCNLAESAKYLKWEGKDST